MNADRAAQADALLDSLQRERGGQLKVFLGAAPGVGKTYAMLNAARELRRQNVDVVVGLVETHGRAETQALLEGLELLPRQSVTYKSHQLTELDLDALLARKPCVAIVDELAHTNAPGSRHNRRYQDIEELLDVGIDVYTTVNIQHIESLNDVVRQITGVHVRETVPDAFLDRARDLVLVDLPPRELIERLQQGKVYVPEQAASALQAFFSPSNLIALRDLAVQQVGDRVDADMREAMAAKGTGPVPVRRRVIAAIDGFDNSEYLVRVTRKIAERRQAPWAVVFVAAGELSAERQRVVDDCFALCRRLGGEGMLLRGTSVVDEILAHASRHAVSTIVIGRTRERPIARMFNRTLTQQLLQKGAHFELTIINTPYARAQARRVLEGNLTPAIVPMGELAYATAATLLAIVLSALAQRLLDFTDLSLLFITAVLFVAVRTRMSVAVYAAFLCFLAYNFFFIEPRYTFYISAGRGVTTVLMFLAAALICGRLANRLRTQIILLRAANAHTDALQTLGQQLATAADENEVYRVGLRALHKGLDAEVVVLSADGAPPRLTEVASEPKDLVLELPARAAADWSLSHQQAAGRGTDTLQGVPWWCLPLISADRSLGVVCLRLADQPGALAPDVASLAQAMVQSMAGALARTRLVTQLEESRVQGETERLRAALLSSVSHDLRSPLATIVGSAESLSLYRDKLSEGDRTVLAENILVEGQRLDRYIQNLLDMTRLGQGALTIEREWIGLDEICGAVLPRLRKLYPALQVELQLPADLPLLFVHPALIEQALFNVLENAAKFSPPDQPVTLSAERDGDELHIKVSDRGPGIPEDERQRIFDMFYSVERGDRDDRAKPGTGLGLTICQGMVAAHGGRVMAMAGADGRGTTVRISLPLTDPPQDPGQEE
jgi:two-component system sensor histidine kinase KdpD